MVTFLDGRSSLKPIDTPYDKRCSVVIKICSKTIGVQPITKRKNVNNIILDTCASVIRDMLLFFVLLFLS